MPNSKATIERRRNPQRLAALAVGPAVALLLAAPAAAHRAPLHPPLPRPDDVSSVNQYVELIPTGGGSKAVTGSRSGEQGLSPLLRARIRAQAGGDAAVLERVASVGRPASLKPRPSAARGRRSGFVGIVSRTTGRTTGATVGLFAAVLVAITAVAGGAAVVRRRRQAPAV